MFTLLRWLRRLFFVVLVIGGGFSLFAKIQEYEPPPKLDVETHCTGDEVPLKAGDTFTVLVWNLQFAATRKHHFFYDGGNVVDVPRADVEAALRVIGDTIAELGPDLLMLQELDVESSRTHDIDQVAAVVERTGQPCWTSAPYHKSSYVPLPLGDALGSVDMHLALMTRAPMRRAVRTQLALLDEMWIRRAFNLKRALLEAQILVDGAAKPLAVAVTHLSAWSHGDGTSGRQVDELVSWIRARPPEQPWILAGDLNLLPPGDDATRLPDGAVYADSVNPIDRLLPAYKEAFDASLSPDARTYLRFGEKTPDRKLDYVFYGGPIELVEARVVHDGDPVSDHLPLLVTFRVTPTP